MNDNSAFWTSAREQLNELCSGQLISDTTLSFFSA